MRASRWSESISFGTYLGSLSSVVHLIMNLLHLQMIFFHQEFKYLLRRYPVFLQNEKEQ
jgi:hypothetical protein